MSTPRLVPAEHSGITRMGRCASLPGGTLRLGFPGTTFRFRYTGPAPILRFHAHTADCHFNLACQSWEPVVLSLLPGENRIALPTGRGGKQGISIELVRRNEAWQGICDFLGLELEAGCELLEPPALSARKLLFIGDSITCGEAIDFFPAAAPAGPRWANAGRSYGMLLGRWLGAQVNLVSYGGRGLVRTWEDKTDEANAPQFFERALPDDISSTWDHASYEPDLISVCLGTNDFNPGLIAQEVFTAAWLNFIARVRCVHPKAPILLLESPIFPDSPEAPDIGKRLLLRACLEAVEAEYSNRGAKTVRVAPLAHYPGTCLDAHPVAFQHEGIALELLPHICQLTGWQAPTSA